MKLFRPDRTAELLALEEELAAAAAGKARLPAPGKSTLTEQLQRLRPASADDLARVPTGAPSALPGALAATIAAQTGHDLGGVRVFRDSARPSLLGAEAYAEGTDIHLGPGAEDHLAHEAWHVVQQLEGRVGATTTRGAARVNDDAALEREADERAAGAAVTMRRPAVAQAPVVQGKFKPADPSGYLWIDDETGQVYRSVTVRERTVMMRRLADGLRLWVKLDDWMPLDDDDPDTRARRLAKPAAKGSAPSSSESEADSPEAPMAFVQGAKPAEPPRYVRPRDPGGRAKAKDKKPSAFTVHVVVAPMPSVALKAAYRAAELLVVSVDVSDERPPTRFQNRTGEDGVESDDSEAEAAAKKLKAKRGAKKKKGQRSHTAAFVLVRAGLEGFAGRPVSDLIQFLARGTEDLLGEQETEPMAVQLAALLDPRERRSKAPPKAEGAEAPASDGAKPKDDGAKPMDDGAKPAVDDGAKPMADDGAKPSPDSAKPEPKPVPLLAAALDAELPMEVWSDLATNGVRSFEIARHKSAAAAYADGGAKGHAEAPARANLDTAERALRATPSAKVAAVYPKGKNPVTDALTLLDAKFGLSLPGPQYARAARTWFELLHLAFPSVMKELNDAIRDEFLKRKVPPGTAASTGKATMAELVGTLDDRGLTAPVAVPGRAYDLGGMSKAKLAAHVRLDPLLGDHDGAVEPREARAAYTADELEVRRIELGETRLPTQFSNQRSHTVAWTLVRASLLAFGRQPLVNLLAFLRHTAEDLVSDLPAELAAEATALATTLGQLIDEKVGLDDWHVYVANAVIEALRLSQKARSATYNKEEHPKGHSEGHYMQVLHENEEHLEHARVLYDAPADVVEAAHTLLDAEFHPELSWQRLARAVILWEEALILRFPRVVATGRAQIIGAMHATPLDRAKAKWVSGPAPALPLLDGSGAAIDTIGALVAYVRTTSGALPIGVDQRVTMPDASHSTGANVTFHARHGVAGHDSLYGAFALGLVGLVSQGAIAPELLERQLPALPDELRAELLGLGGESRNPSSARAIQRVLAPLLRLRAREVVAQVPELCAEIEALCVAELTRLVKTPSAPSAIPPGSPLADGKAGVVAAMRDQAMKLTAPGAPVGAELDAAIAAWAKAHAVKGYVARLGEPDAGGSTIEQRALGFVFQVETITLSGDPAAAARSRGTAFVRPTPIRIVGPDGKPDGDAPPFTMAELDELVRVKAVVGNHGTLAAPILEFGAVWPEDIDKLAIDVGLRERYRALVTAGRTPTLGVYRGADGKSQALTTVRGNFDLRSGAAPAQDGGGWHSEGLPEETERRVIGASGGQMARAAVEGTFTAAGDRHVVWRTAPDNNCAYNAMAMAIMGLVAQHKLSVDDLVARTKLGAELWNGLAADAGRLQADDGAAQRIQLALAGPLRALAVKAVEARPHLLERLHEELMSEVRGRVYVAFGLPFDRLSDLFVDPGSSIVAAVRTYAEQIVRGIAKTVVGDPKAKEKAIDQQFALNRLRLVEWITKTGAPAYLAGLAKDRVWAGSLELHGLADLLGVRVVTFTDLGGGLYARDAGVGTSGSAPRGDLTDDEITQLRAIDVIEGGPPAAKVDRVFFKRLTPAQLAKKWAKAVELGKRFQPIYDAHYPFREHDPVEIGVFRHRARAHWSAMTADGGGYDLNDETDYQGGRRVPERAIDGAPSSKGSSLSGGKDGGLVFRSKAEGPTEGGFTARGADRVAWKTEADNNCAFNSMALAIAGAVAQGRLSADRLVARGLDAKLLAEVAADAKELQTKPEAAVRVQQAMAMPLRTLAVAAVRARPESTARLHDELLAELRGRVYTAFGVRFGRFSDLFNDPGLPVMAALSTKADALVAALVAAIDGTEVALREKIVDAYFHAERGTLAAWCAGEGAKTYLEGLGKDKVWAGSLELHALAAHLGVALMLFRDAGGGVITRDEGVNNNGSAPRGALTDAHIETLRRLDLIEGGPPAAEVVNIYFRRVDRASVERALAGQVALAGVYGPIYLANYPYLDAAPVELGVFRHRQRAHWSAATNAVGGYDLNDATDRRPSASPLTSHPVDSAGEWVSELVATTGAPTTASPSAPSTASPSTASPKTASPSAPSTAAKISFQRKALAAPVETAYADHMFGGKHGAFDLTKVDPAHKSGETTGLVNAANSGLRWGGGIDGAIISQEGTALNASGVVRPSREVELDKRGIMSAAVGESVTTSGGDMNKLGVDGVIHTVGPQLGHKAPWDALRACVGTVLAEAAAHKFHVLIMCNVSSDNFGLPAAETGTVIRAEIERLLNAPPSSWGGWMPVRVVFNKFPVDTPIVPAVKPGDGKPGDGPPKPPPPSGSDSAPKPPPPSGSDGAPRPPPPSGSVGGSKLKRGFDSEHGPGRPSLTRAATALDPEALASPFAWPPPVRPERPPLPRTHSLEASLGVRVGGKRDRNGELITAGDEGGGDGALSDDGWSGDAASGGELSDDEPSGWGLSDDEPSGDDPFAAAFHFG